ncbi:MAG: dihydrofolate reductase [Prevotella sp.]|nr:dihydrofolate reductase [Prevotella sp.]
MISIIAAVAKNRAIGYKNQLIYWLPNDLKRFKALTTGHTIIMGRNTFLSLPKGALPNRRNIVLSRSAFSSSTGEAGRKLTFPGCDVYPSLEEALQHCTPEEDIYIIGGASVYRQALPLAERLCLTEIDDTPENADTFFPPYEDEWQEESREDHPIDDRHNFRYSFVDYIRKQAE